MIFCNQKVNGLEGNKVYSLFFILTLLLDCCAPSVSVKRENCKQNYIKDSPLIMVSLGLTNEELNQMLTGLLTGYLMCLHSAETKGDPGPSL